MRMQHEHGAAALRPLLDRADGRIAVFDRERKRAGHERRAHALEFALRHAAVEDQPLGAAADARRSSARTRTSPAAGAADRLVAQLGPPVADIPESFAAMPTPDLSPCSPRTRTVMPATGKLSYILYTLEMKAMLRTHRSARSRDRRAADLTRAASCSSRWSALTMAGADLAPGATRCRPAASAPAICCWSCCSR